MFFDPKLARQFPQKGKEGSVGVCCRLDAHKDQRIQYICLEENCTLHRQLCKRCVTELHRKHRVGRIDKLIAPLNRLSMNSHHQSSSSDYAYFQERIGDIIAEWEKLHGIFEKNMRELENGILLQMKAVMKTFSSEELDRVHDLMLDSNADLEEVNESVSIINFLDRKECLEDVETVRSQAATITTEVTKWIKKVTLKVDYLMKKMQHGINHYNFNSVTHPKDDPSQFKKEEEEREDANESHRQKDDERKQDERVKAEARREDKREEPRREQKSKLKEQKDERKEGQKDQKKKEQVRQRKEEDGKQRKEVQHKERDSMRQQDEDKRLGVLTLEYERKQEQEQEYEDFADLYTPPGKGQSSSRKENEPPRNLHNAVPEKTKWIRYK